MTSTETLSAVSQTSSSSAFSRGTKSSAEGRSHNHWNLYRREVLAPHHIRIVESTVLPDKLPKMVVAWINANRDNVARFTRQRKHFRNQVAEGRGFGDSALFPHEVLPWSRDQSSIAKCMVPTYSTDPLPKRMIPDPTGKLSLAPPRPGFACGFASSAFAFEELKNIPDFLATSGTTLQFDTGSVSPDSALYCPFLTFERTFYQQKYGHEIAANQCAVDGAWCVRSLQMLYKKANGDSRDFTFEDPVSFTCAIDNNFAIINYHWIDHAQTYCMAPVVKFELSRDDHFNQFLVWIEAIGQWAVSCMLPEVKKAICLITDTFGEESASRQPTKTSQNTTDREGQRLVSALKLSYGNISWRLEGDESSAVSSSTAVPGSPTVNEAYKPKYPVPPTPTLPAPLALQAQMQMPGSPRTLEPPSSACSEPTLSRAAYFANSPHRERSELKLKPALDVSLSPWGTPTVPNFPSNLVERAVKPSVDTNEDLAVGKRLSYAMDEIKDLQRRIENMKQEFDGSTTCLQNELSGLRKSMTTVLRKDKLSFRQGLIIRGNAQDGSSKIQTDKYALGFEKGGSVVTTPTDPTARPVWARGNNGTAHSRRPSGLQNVLSCDTKLSPSADDSESQSPRKITIHSPTTIDTNTDDSEVEDEETEEVEEDYRASIRVPHTRQNDLSAVFTSHVLCTLVPSAMLRVIFLGLVLDYCMAFVGGTSVQSVSHYISHVLEGTITV